MAKRLSGEQARAGVRRIAKWCPSCGGGFSFSLTANIGGRNAVIDEFVRMLGKGEVVIQSVEEAEEELRQGRGYIHPLVPDSRGDAKWTR